MTSYDFYYFITNDCFSQSVVLIEHLLGGRNCDKCFMFIVSLNLHTAMWVLYPYFIDEETVAWSD